MQSEERAPPGPQRLADRMKAVEEDDIRVAAQCRLRRAIGIFPMRPLAGARTDLLAAIATARPASIAAHVDPSRAYFPLRLSRTHAAEPGTKASGKRDGPA
ncbi:MAG: hypothetical protein NVS2B5_27960 [Beijerinckiaceae bacterium]